MPPYTRFLKHLCTTKRVTSIWKKPFLVPGANFIIFHQIPVKYKDPSCPTISIVIEHQLIHKALLDLGANVDLLPFSEFESLGLGELN